MTDSVSQVIEEEKLQENCAVVGDYFLKQLSSIDSHLIGDVRGKGLMIGVELIDEDGKPLTGDRLANIFEGIKSSCEKMSNIFEHERSLCSSIYKNPYLDNMSFMW
uniref:Alanine--glyoxylate aminotransferase 2, mitochondrial n=1 Tax=Angiostrongylus cantonensis TaxID=6313 RepID=A0A0K0D4X4_ANGCA